MTAIEKSGSDAWSLLKKDFDLSKLSTADDILPFYRYNKPINPIHDEFSRILVVFARSMQFYSLIIMGEGVAEKSYTFDVQQLLAVEGDVKLDSEAEYSFELDKKKQTVTIKDPTFIRKFLPASSSSKKSDKTSVPDKTTVSIVKVVFKAIATYFSSHTHKIADFTDGTFLNKDIMAHFYHNLFIQIGFKSEKSAFDFEPFGVTKEATKVDFENISCYAFALMKAKVVKASEFIFKYSKKANDEFAADMFGNLKRYGCVPTDSPKAGDIVLYANIRDENLEVQHFGVLLANGYVISKFGQNNPRVYKHPICQTPYGSSVIFYRCINAPTSGLGEAAVKVEKKGKK